MSRLNRVMFKREVSAQIKNAAFPIIRGRMEEFFNREKNRAIAEFEGHPVTQELKSYTPEQRSQFLPQGNLTALMGYENIQEEVNTIRDSLDSSEIVFIGRGRTLADGSYVVTARADIPSVASIDESTPLPWQEQNGIVTAIERGVSGFFRTLFGANLKGSRSGGAIQTKNKVRDFSFPGLGRNTWVGGILKNLATKLRAGPRFRK